MEEPEKVPTWEEIEAERAMMRAKKAASAEPLKEEGRIIQWFIGLGYNIMHFAVTIAAILLITNIYSYARTGRTQFSELPAFPSPECELLFDDDGEIGYDFPTEVNGAPIHEMENTLPGDYLNMHPYVKNVGEADFYAFLEIESCGLDPDEVEFAEDDDGNPDAVEPNAAGVIPIYVYELNDGWELVEETLSDDRLHSIYAYTKPVAPGDYTLPLCDYVRFVNFSSRTYSNMTDDDMGLHFETVVTDIRGLNLDSPAALQAVYHSIKRESGEEF